MEFKSLIENGKALEYYTHEPRYICMDNQQKHLIVIINRKFGMNNDNQQNHNLVDIYQYYNRFFLIMNGQIIW